MKKNRKITKLLLLAVMMLMLAACGKKEKTSATDSGEEFVYVPEYQSIEGICEELSAAVSVENKIFLSATEYQQNEGTVSAYLYEYDVESSEIKKIPSEFGKNSRIIDMCSDAQGEQLNLMVYRYEENEEGITSFFELWGYDIAKDSLEMKYDVTSLIPEDGYIYNCLVDNEGNYYLNFDQRNLYVYNRELAPAGEIPMGDMFSGLFHSKEGDIYASVWGDDGIEFKKVDLSTKSLGPKIKTEEWGIQKCAPAISGSILLETSDSLKTYDFETNEKQKLFDWISVDIDSNNVYGFGELPGEQYWVLLADYGETEVTHELVIIRKVKADEALPKQELVLGTMYMEDQMKQAVIAFNKSNENYHITVKSYGEMDYEDGLKQMSMDLTTGNTLDMIDLLSLDYHQYAYQGVLEDLYPYMEKSGIRKEDYFENVLRAYEVEGKLYAISPEFYISTVLTKSASVNGATGWTLSEMLDFANEKGAENMFAYGSKDYALGFCVYNNMDAFVDWKEGKCYFDSDDFIRVLEFAQQFPEEYVYHEDAEGQASKLHNNRLYLMDSSIYSIETYQMFQGMFGEKISFIGYPNKERKGNQIYPAGGFLGICAKSTNKDGAWEFLNGILTKEYQDSLTSSYMSVGFPICISSTEKQFEADMTKEYETDENGEKVESVKTHWSFDDFDMDIYAATQEDVDAMMTLLRSTETLRSDTDMELQGIISEETAPYFQGQKTAAEVANIIQNRIQVYVNENK